MHLAVLNIIRQSHFFMVAVLLYFCLLPCNITCILGLYFNLTADSLIQHRLTRPRQLQ